jgi:hypothetical protein
VEKAGEAPIEGKRAILMTYRKLREVSLNNRSRFCYSFQVVHCFVMLWFYRGLKKSKRFFLILTLKCIYQYRMPKALILTTLTGRKI